MMHFLVFAAAVAGFACLCVAMARHQQDLLGRRLTAPQTRAARRAGWGALGVALVFAVAGFGWAYGPIVWTGHLSAAAASVVAILTWRSRRPIKRPTKGDAR